MVLRDAHTDFERNRRGLPIGSKISKGPILGPWTRGPQIISGFCLENCDLSYEISFVEIARF